jgi:hypothetical protein
MFGWVVTVMKLVTRDDGTKVYVPDVKTKWRLEVTIDDSDYLDEWVYKHAIVKAIKDQARMARSLSKVKARKTRVIARWEKIK